jgi:uncharacterized heparinase superfamily protein
MMPMLRFFRHGDGNFAQFNGMGATPIDLLATVLAYDDARGAPLSNAPHSGYQRLEAGQSSLIMDTGRPPPLAVSQEAHAGCLSFEMCWKHHRLIVNCGLPSVNRETWRQVARATPGHSTATLNERSSCQFPQSGAMKRLLAGIPIVAGPHHVPVEHYDEGDGAQVLCASHDGYLADCGLIHTRTLKLSADGRVLDGEDAFHPAEGQSISPKAGDEYAIRLHLHPSIKASRLSDGRGVILLLPDREVWTFATFADSVQIEESVFLSATEGPRRTVQIVIYGQARVAPTVRWSLRHTPPAPLDARADRADEPELPL